MPNKTIPYGPLPAGTMSQARQSVINMRREMLEDFALDAFFLLYGDLTESGHTVVNPTRVQDQRAAEAVGRALLRILDVRSTRRQRKKP